MTTDTLDTLGRQAATDLHTRSSAVDTEAALARIGSPGGGHRRPGRSLGRLGRPVTVAAVLLLVTGVVGAGLIARRAPSSTEREPAVGGPVVASTTGPNGELLELHARPAILDGDEVIVTVTGADPSVELALTQCRTATGDVRYNPAAHCTNAGSAGRAAVGPDGTASASLPVWSRFDGQAGTRTANTCGPTDCVLQLTLNPAAGGPVATGEDLRPTFVLPLPFAGDAGGPSAPRLSVRRVGPASGTTAEPVAVELDGEDLEPGRALVELVAYRADRLGPPMQFVKDAGRVEVARIEIGSDGRLSNTVGVPRSVVPAAGGEAVVCGADGVTCDLRVTGVDRPDGGRVLDPQPVPFPLR